MSNVKPVIIQKNNLKSLKCMGYNIVQEDVIYKATPNDFLKGKYPNLVISNKVNKLNNSSQTKASFSSNNSSVVELTSDAVTQLIGQRNYDIVFAALCSVINQDLKIRALLSLLTTKKITNDGPKLRKFNVATQTEQSCMALLIKEKKRRNCRSRIATPYVVTDQLTKVIIHPNEIKCDISTKKSQIKKENCEQDIPDLKLMEEELSNTSWGSTGNISILSDKIPNTILHPQFMLNNIDKYTEDILSLHNTSAESLNGPDTAAQPQLDNMTDPINTKLEDSACVTNNDSLGVTPSEERLKLIIQQALVDYKTCILRDQDDNLPLHQAVLEDNVSMLKRHCVMLNKREESVDELSGSHFTALQMSIFHNSVRCIEVLLQFGADMFVTDDEGRTCFHLAAEKDSDHLKLLVEHCKKDANTVLRQNEDLWNAFSKRESSKGICEFLLDSISIMCDSQGYTPLMLASKAGVAKNVKLLVDISPDTINMMMPNTGNTALYLAVAAACLDADDCEDNSNVSQNYLQTVETLIVNGGNPYLQNSSGTKVNDLLAETIAKDPKDYLVTLSLLIANKLTSVKYFKGNTVENFEKYMLIRNSEGDISIADINKKEVKRRQTSKRAGNSKSVTSDHSDISVLRVDKELCYIIESPAERNINEDKLKILNNISIVNANQVTQVPTKISINNKSKTAITQPLILQNKSKSEVKIKTYIGNQQKCKFLKILPKLESGIKSVSATKRSNSDVEPTSSKKIKPNSVT